MSILSRKIYAACSSEIFLSETLVENQNCTISVGIFSVYISQGGITLIHGVKLIVKFRSHVIGFSHGAKLIVKTHSHGVKLFVKTHSHTVRHIIW